MSQNTWSHRLARPMAHILAKAGVSPNAVTLASLALGLAAAGAFAAGTREWTIVAGAVFVFSCFLDRLDGELARAGKTQSDFGAKLDRYCNLVVFAAVFIGIGIGSRNSLIGGWAPLMGMGAAAAVTTIYVLRQRLRARHGKAHTDTASVKGHFDHDDILYLLGPVAWLGLELPFLILACVGAPTYAFYVWLRYRSLEHVRRTSAVSTSWADDS